jgi:3-(3-hydroxy-phenyl)propionate hydroxylase
MPFELEWVSLYTFQCRRLARFRHGRVLFLGDAAHQVSPFGARGGNSGIQDSDNLAWKLALVIAGKAPASLLDSYESERGFAADENILHSTRSTEFISPKGKARRRLRDAVLSLAADHGFARAMVNSGRLSVPCILPAEGLQTPDAEPWPGGVPPGAALPDAPLRAAGGRDCWLLGAVGGRFAVLLFEPEAAAEARLADTLRHHPVGADIVVLRSMAPATGDAWLHDHARLAEQRLALQPGCACLMRPDQHVAARWRAVDAKAILAALDRAAGRTGPPNIEAAA